MRRYLIFFAVTVSIVLLPSALLSLFFGPIDGDLTRMGGYAERDFGWNASQPVVNLNANGKAITNPDILVLGDSFSVGNVWQSVLTTKLNKKILSYHFDQVGCINNWIEYALKQPLVKIVVIESVERELIGRFGGQPTCKYENPIPFEMSPTTSFAKRTTWPPEWHIKQTFRVAKNTLEMNLRAHASVRDNIVNAPINNDHCAKFSNLRSDRILFIAEDENKLHWRSEDMTRAISNILNIQKAFAEHGKIFVLVVVPDKLSVYRHCLLNDTVIDTRKWVNITNSLIVSDVNTPDLLRAFQENANKIVDLYNPNNTHLSVGGYIFMAEQLEQFFTSKSNLLLH